MSDLFQAHLVNGKSYLIGKEMVRYSISKIKNSNIAGVSGLLSEMLKPAG